MPFDTTIHALNFTFKYVGDKLSRKILDQALEQQDELEAECGGMTAKKGKKPLAEARTSLGSASKPRATGSDSESDSEEDFSEGEDQYYEDVVSRDKILCSLKPIFSWLTDTQPQMCKLQQVCCRFVALLSSSQYQNAFIVSATCSKSANIKIFTDLLQRDKLSQQTCCKFFGNCLFLAMLLANL